LDPGTACRKGTFATALLVLNASIEAARAEELQRRGEPVHVLKARHYPVPEPTIYHSQKSGASCVSGTTDLEVVPDVL